MITIFQDMLETSMEVFMDEFFDISRFVRYMSCKSQTSSLGLNWEKCHFMVTEGIVLRHKVSSVGLEVDKEKINVISKLPPPTNIKAVRIFLGHAGFYRRFIKDFYKISRPMTKLLEKDAVFDFNKECIEAFQSLKEKLTNVPIMVSPDWSQPFELMCDTSNFAVGAFNIEIKNKKGAENVMADHLSRLENPHLEELKDDDIDDNFPDETLMNVSSTEEDKIPWRCVYGAETRKTLDECHHGPTGGHYCPSTTAKKVFDAGFCWPTILKEAHTLVQNCDACQRSGSLSQRDEMPQNNIQVKAEALPTNDARVMINFLKKIFSRFGIPKALISNREEGKMEAISFMAPFLADYRETMPWVIEKPFIYSVVENTCNEAKLYDLDETSEGIVKGNFLYVKKDPSKKSPLKEK
ncbi:reverse transcriptase domain-containing protein [Tanacetum coccineum]|uniref:Reverse transcriptase domain-containing protein n=1 Tax=Tanacetum coccineum TaxID=301880 RepID=A0ABQ5CGZ5_9ASTR